MKLLVCDMCGTLIEYEKTNSSWEQLNDILGIDKEQNEKLRKRWLEEEDYSYLEYSHDTISLYLQKNIQKSHIEELKEKTIYKSGIQDLVEFADRKNMNTIIITGGIGNVADMIYKDFGFDSYHSTCYFEFYENSLIRYNLEKCGGSSEKLDILKKHIQEKDIQLDEVVFVGDGLNDINLTSASGESFNIGDKNLGSDYSINSLSEIPEHLD